MQKHFQNGVIMRKLIHKKEEREVYYDGQYIIKKMPTVWLDLDSYNAFRKLHPEWLVKIIDIDPNTIVMEKIEGQMFHEFRLDATPDQLYNVCIDFKDKLWKAYFDFNESRTGTRWIQSTQKMFFNMDASPGNVIIRDGKPVYIDPDAWTWTEWDLFIQKIRLDDMVWFNEYIKYGFRTHE